MQARASSSTPSSRERAMTKAPRLCVVGSSNTDMIVHCERLPAPGETVLGGDVLVASGGKGANQAVALARLGAQVSLVARVGTDIFGDQTMVNLSREGVEMRHVVRDRHRPSGVALITVDARGENIITVAPGANSALSPADVEAAEEAIASASALIVQMEIPPETVAAAVDAAWRLGVRVVLNPAPARPLPEALLRKVELLVPNESELRFLAGVDDDATVEKAARALLARGCGAVVVTLGAQGALLVTSSGSARVPAFKVKAVDAVGAGDAFVAALAYAVCSGKDLEAATTFACAAAALATTKRGAQPSLPTLGEVEAFLGLGAL